MRHNLLPIAAALALLPLAACQNEPETVDTTAPDPLASQIANAAPVELPPPVTATVTFRCEDNSLVYVDFFEGDKMVNFRTEQGVPPVRLRAPEAGQPYVGEGYEVAGTPEQITVTQPGGESLTCNA